MFNRGLCLLFVFSVSCLGFVRPADALPLTHAQQNIARQLFPGFLQTYDLVGRDLQQDDVAIGYTYANKEVYLRQRYHYYRNNRTSYLSIFYRPATHLNKRKRLCASHERKRTVRHPRLGPLVLCERKTPKNSQPTEHYRMSAYALDQHHMLELKYKGQRDHFPHFWHALRKVERLDPMRVKSLHFLSESLFYHQAYLRLPRYRLTWSELRWSGQNVFWTQRYWRSAFRKKGRLLNPGDVIIEQCLNSPLASVYSGKKTQTLPYRHAELGPYLLYTKAPKSPLSQQSSVYYHRIRAEPQKGNRLPFSRVYVNAYAPEVPQILRAIHMSHP